MGEKSKILIIGATGYLGKFITGTSVKLGHETFALIRETTASNNPDKSKLIDHFTDSGVKLVYGDIYNHESLVDAIKQVDVVISAVSDEEVADQRFIPSEFVADVDRMEAVYPATSRFEEKAKIRRMIETEEIPYTYVVCYNFAGSFLPAFAQSFDGKEPPRDKVIIFGDGNTKEDIATYTMKAVDDPRTLNKILYMRPPANILSFHDLVSMWESKIGKLLGRTYISEDELLKGIQDAPMPRKLNLAIAHCTLVKGANFDFETDTSSGVEASQLYPEVTYTTVDEYLNQFV
ncbi:hypothetical protein BUALT_Bualt11G0000600 [Buddleja alternifolia]|uniref:NmrA-like domain-containing protein n=1 Tax=Buddleja alternifolia TaxID=168488 RepID=A0AAV6WZV5_9LAMI|nr:hypothetical protein BUALT_Bualt11G0000600 [Buddleja alternifolia]